MKKLIRLMQKQVEIKRIFLVFIMFATNLAFSSNKPVVTSPPPPMVITITDATLANVYYHQTNYAVPTKLVFQNLTSVSGFVYFQDNVNLVEVDFPLLQNTDDYVYFNGNLDLNIINAPSLTTVSNYLSISGNPLLTQLNICALTDILPTGTSAPYYDISGNNATIDAIPQCFSVGAPTNLQLTGNTIIENQSVNTLVGTLSALGNGSALTYYLPEFELDNDNFIINGSQLETAVPFDFEIQNTYTVRIGVRNQLGETIEADFTVNVIDIVNESITTIQISDVTLDNIYYHQENFTGPTKLVFPNLTSVTGFVYFYENVNLVEVDFPLLQNTGDYVYFNGNAALDIINAPSLTTVSNYLSISGNPLLTQLNICALTDILPIGTSAPYYDISGNNAVIDATPQCFSVGAPTNILLDNTTILENQNLNSTIGLLSATGTGTLTYYLTENEIDNESFTIINGNELVTATPLDFETKSTYTIEIGVRNQLGEKIESQFTVNIIDIVTENITTIYITDTTLNSIYYHEDTSFVTPTKLVFTNLTDVTGYVYFHKNINLVEVDFPQLQNTGDYFYVNKNPSLVTVNAPNLNTVYKYFYTLGNESLLSLNICSLSNILRPANDPNYETYYYIVDNILLDYSTTCLPESNMMFTPADPIIILPPPNTLIGNFTITPNATIQRYYFIDSFGNEVTNHPDFSIYGDQLYLLHPYSSYTASDFNIEITAIRSSTTRSANSIGLNEKVALNFSVNIDNAVVGLNNVIVDDNSIEIYPNPSNNYINIDSNKSLNLISLFDISGKNVKTFIPSEKKYYVGDISPGVYFVKLQQVDNVKFYFKKLIIK